MCKWLEGELPEATHPIIPLLAEVAIFDVTQKEELLKRFLVPDNFSRSFASVDDQSRKFFIRELHMLALKHAEAKREAAKEKIAAAAAAKRNSVRKPRPHVPLYTEQMHPADVEAARQREEEIKERVARASPQEEARAQARRFQTPAATGVSASSSSVGTVANIRHSTISVNASSNVHIGLHAPMRSTATTKTPTNPIPKKKTTTKK